jgi:hypothetical protein
VFVVPEVLTRNELKPTATLPAPVVLEHNALLPTLVLVETSPPPLPTHTPFITASFAAVNVVPSNWRFVEPVIEHVPSQYVTRFAAPEPVMFPVPDIEEVLK